MSAFVMAAAAMFCLFLPGKEFNALDRFALMLSIWGIVTMLASDIKKLKKHDKRRDFRRMITMTTLPGKQHTLDRVW